MKPAYKPVLCVVSSHPIKGASGVPTGFFLAELTHPLKVLEDAGGEAAEQGQSTSASSGGDKTGQSEEQKTEAVSVDEATTKVQKEEDRQSFLKS